MTLADDRSEKVRLAILVYQVNQIVKQACAMLDLPVVVSLTDGYDQTLAVPVKQIGDPSDAALHRLLPSLALLFALVAYRQQRTRLTDPGDQ